MAPLPTGPRRLRAPRDPFLEGAVRERTTRLLGSVLAASLAVNVLLAALTWFHRPEREGVEWTYEFGFVVTLAAAILRRLGRQRAAGVVLSAGFWTLAVCAIVLMGGPASPGTFLLVPVVLTAALFWSWRAAAVLAASGAALVLVTAWLGVIGALPVPRVTPSLGTMAGVCAACLAIAGLLSHVLLSSLRAAVEEARNRREELLTLFRESPDAIVVLDDTGIIRDANPASLTMAGLHERDVIDHHFASIGALLSADAAVAIRRFPGLIRGTRRTFGLRLIRLDGAVSWGEARARVLSGPDGGKRVQVTIRDTTRRKLAEQRRVELEGHVSKLQRLETIGRYSGAVAHDVNNLLAVVALVASSLKSRLGPDDTELADELVESATRAAKLNRRLLLVGRQDATGADAIDINAVIDGMRRMLARIAGDAVELRVELDRRPCVVRADAAQLEQMIINLAANARDAMPQHGRMTIATEVSMATVKGRPEPAREEIVLRVSDTGVGMNSETQRHLFEPFFTTKGLSGTGLGLATVRDIVRGCGGRIDVVSQPGHGTEFAIALPCAAPEATGGVSEVRAPR
ncbi:MAG TPA: ATP-binding protein [Polyangiaceae bacterium]|nr:ATP-binding protein [Polyangiaceae bacterium]